MFSTSPSIVVQEKEVHQGFPGFAKYTVSAVETQAAGSATVTISSSSSGQSLILPVTLMHMSDPGAAKKGETFLAAL